MIFAAEQSASASFCWIGVRLMEGQRAQPGGVDGYPHRRPVTAIRAGDTDGNPYTEADPEWTPFISTPVHPEYIAPHSTVGASTSGFYTVWFGTDRLPLDFKGTTGAVRHYESVEQIHAEESNAPVWGDMHWRHSTEVGTRIGTRVGHYTPTHLLSRLVD